MKNDNDQDDSSLLEPLRKMTSFNTDYDFEQFAAEVEETIQDQDDDDPVAMGMNIFKKIDLQNKGYVDTNQLRIYTIQQMQEVSPTTPFDEADFQAGFYKIDRDGDGRITPADIIEFTRQKLQQA